MHGRVVLGVTGGIAAYKSVNLLRLLVRAGVEVRVVMTDAAREFVGPLTFSTLSGGPVYREFYERSTGQWNSHVGLAEWADAMVVAPATANTLAKMAGGVADNLLLTTYLSCRGEVVVAPAMDLTMYAHAATQANLDILRDRGVRIVEPEEGYLASGLHGKGRMAAEGRIWAEVISALGAEGSMKGKRVLVTSGCTREAIDPVRYVGNSSSGYMGCAVVNALARRGAEVHCVSGPAQHQPIASSMVHVHAVESAEQMRNACEALWPGMDIGVMVAAVADYRPRARSEQKLRRVEGEELRLELVPNPDIAAGLGARKGARQLLVGFALETDGGTARAREKMARKGFDICVYNRQVPGVSGTGAHDNEAIILFDSGSEQIRGRESKESLAEGIMQAVEGTLRARGALGS